MSRCPLSISPSMIQNLIPSVTRGQAAGPALEPAIGGGAAFLERALKLLRVLAFEHARKLRRQRRERRRFIGGERLARGGERRSDAERRRGGDLPGKRQRAVERLARRRHFCLPPDRLSHLCVAAQA